MAGPGKEKDIEAHFNEPIGKSENMYFICDFCKKRISLTVDKHISRCKKNPNRYKLSSCKLCGTTIRISKIDTHLKKCVKNPNKPKEAPKTGQLSASEREKILDALQPKKSTSIRATSGGLPTLGKKK